MKMYRIQGKTIKEISDEQPWNGKSKRIKGLNKKMEIKYKVQSYVIK